MPPEPGPPIAALMTGAISPCRSRWVYVSTTSVASGPAGLKSTTITLACSSSGAGRQPGPIRQVSAMRPGGVHSTIVPLVTSVPSAPRS